MTKQSKPAELPRKGGSFVRDDTGTLTQTAGPAVNTTATSGKPATSGKTGKPAKPTKEES